MPRDCAKSQGNGLPVRPSEIPRGKWPGLTLDQTGHGSETQLADLDPGWPGAWPSRRLFAVGVMMLTDKTIGSALETRRQIADELARVETGCDPARSSRVTRCA